MELLRAPSFASVLKRVLPSCALALCTSFHLRTSASPSHLCSAKYQAHFKLWCKQRQKHVDSPRSFHREVSWPCIALLPPQSPCGQCGGQLEKSLHPLQSSCHQLFNISVIDITPSSRRSSNGKAGRRLQRHHHSLPRSGNTDTWPGASQRDGYHVVLTHNVGCFELFQHPAVQPTRF